MSDRGRDTVPKVKITEDINIGINVGGSANANATGSIKAGDSVDIKLFQGDCTDANHNSGGTKFGDTIHVILQNTDPNANGYIDSNGEVHIGQLTYPTDFGTNPPQLVNGNYWWNVVYSPSSSNTDVTGSDDGCTEIFTISGLKSGQTYEVWLHNATGGGVVTGTAG